MVSMVEQCAFMGACMTVAPLANGLTHASLCAVQTLVADADVEDLCSKSSSCSMGGSCAHANAPCGSMQCGSFPEDLKQHVKVGWSSLQKACSAHLVV